MSINPDLEAEQRELISAIVRLQNKVHVATCVTPSMQANHRLIEFAVKELGLGIKKGVESQGSVKAQAVVKLAKADAVTVSEDQIKKQEEVVKAPTDLDSHLKDTQGSLSPESAMIAIKTCDGQNRQEIQSVPLTEQRNVSNNKPQHRKASQVFDSDDGGSSSDFSQGWDDEEAAALERLESAMMKGTEARE